MKCPSCGHLDSKVIDSRPSADNASIRRRRECLNCQRRFTTYETIETVPIIVIKKDKSRESFDRNKILNSIIRACDKRQVTRGQMEAIVNEIESALQNSLQSEVPSSVIGEMVMSRLKMIDEVAYVRFASVYRQFKDINDFMEELKKLLAEK
ncbi:MAG TPA: transcriptional regulator NrdR [Bacillota bacterium]|nr:transcriptional regulator NrdR [Bacillota bacterium]HOK69284.1 transcriptional regulator NrdR [Bacillota bacterium]HPP85414.1 transcriptional regulator NrdR [Bacillota bacterium]